MSVSHTVVYFSCSTLGGGIDAAGGARCEEEEHAVTSRRAGGVLFLLPISLPRILHVPKVVLHQERVREIVLLFLKKEQIGENAHLLVQRLLGKGVIMIKIVQKPNVVLIIALMSMELLAPMLRKH